jgi:hypothetical protein
MSKFQGPGYFWARLACNEATYDFPSRAQSAASSGFCSFPFLPAYRAYMVFCFLVALSAWFSQSVMRKEILALQKTNDVPEVWVKFQGPWGMNTVCVECTSVEPLIRCFVRCKQIEMECHRRQNLFPVKVVRDDSNNTWFGWK